VVVTGQAGGGHPVVVLLQLVEDHRFTMKQGPTPSSRKGNKRA
jgi:hypothetical protein